MKKTVAIIGGGASAMMLACKLDSTKFNISIYEKNKGLGRKFLVAGNGGFNLTHASSIDEMIVKYEANQTIINSLTFFDNKNTIEWLNEIGIPTYTGSSKRIFPKKNIKPIRVLNAIEEQLALNKVDIFYQHEWIGFGDKKELIFSANNEGITISADIVVFALGGASWKVTGSNDRWLSYFENKGINTIPFESSNCAFKVKWKKAFIDEFEGEPLKNIQISLNKLAVKGELVLTQFGIEGGAIYALSNAIRKELNKHGSCTIHLNLKPNSKREALIRKLNEPKKKNSWSEHIIWKLKLTKAMFQLIKRKLSKEDFMIPDKVADILQSFPLELTDIAPIDEAISTVGGIDLNNINEHFELSHLPNHFIIGEMLNWDAPTGGYLLQANFSMGAYLADYLNTKD